MKVRTLIAFNDLQSKKLRRIGEEFEAPNKRVDEINSTSHGALVVVVEETQVKKKPIKKKVGE
jgi:hypothetical protein